MSKSIPNWQMYLIVWVASCILSYWLVYSCSLKNVYPADGTSGDCINALVSAGMIAKTGWCFHSSQLSWPEGAPYCAFPFDGNLYFLIQKLLSVFTKDPFSICGWSVGLTTVLGSLLACFYLRACGCSKITAMAFGLIFGFSPQVFFRLYAHSHTLPYLVPITAAPAFLILANRLPSCTRRTKILFGIFIFIGGFGYIYHACFGLFFLFIATFLRWFQAGWRDESFRFGSTAMALLILSTAINIFPAFVEFHRDPALSVKITEAKKPGESEVYGLRILHLVRPVAPTIVTKEIDKLIRKGKYPFSDTETAVARLGTLGTIGFIFLLFYLFIYHTTKAPVHQPSPYLALSLLVLAALLLGMPGGLGSMINLIRSDIRAYNRLSSYIHFFSLLTIALLLTKLEARRQYSIGVKTLYCILAIIITILGCWDQRCPNPCFVQKDPAVDSVRSMLQKIDPVLANNSKIFTLPVTDYPPTIWNGDMPQQQDALPFLLTDKYSWSTMPMSTCSWQKQTWFTTLRGMELAQELRAEGYDAVWLDQRATAGLAKDVFNSMVPLEHIQKIDSDDKRYSLLLLDDLPLNPTNSILPLSQVVFTGMADDNKNFLKIVRQEWLPIEPHGVWSAQRAWLCLPYDTPTEDLILTLQISPGSQTRHLDLIVNGKFVKKLTITKPADYETRIQSAYLRKINILELYVPDAPKPTPGEYNMDHRKRGIFLTSLTLKTPASR